MECFNGIRKLHITSRSKCASITSFFSLVPLSHILFSIWLSVSSLLCKIIALLLSECIWWKRFSACSRNVCARRGTQLKWLYETVYESELACLKRVEWRKVGTFLKLAVLDCCNFLLIFMSTSISLNRSCHSPRNIYLLLMVLMWILIVTVTLFARHLLWSKWVVILLGCCVFGRGILPHLNGCDGEAGGQRAKTMLPGFL